MAHEADSTAPRGETAQAEPHEETAFATTLHWVEHELGRPGVGALVVGGALVVAATMSGVSETLVGAAGAYVVYRVLKRRKARHARAA